MSRGTITLFLCSRCEFNSHQLSCNLYHLYYKVEGRKEMFYLTMHSIHLLMVIWHQTYGKGPHRQREEGRKEMFYLMTHSTHLLTVIWRQTYGKGPHR